MAYLEPIIAELRAQKGARAEHHWYPSVRENLVLITVPYVHVSVPACMDCLEAATICACICFQSAGGKLIIVKRL